MKKSCAFRLNSSIQIYQVSSQGTFLSDRRRVWIQTRLFGREKTSKRHPVTFPIVFNESYQIERTFTNAHNLATLADILTVEVISIDLVQHSDTRRGGRVIAHYESSVQDFLFPAAKHTFGGIQFTLMTKSKQIKNPIQLSYSTKTLIEEVPLSNPVRMPDYLSPALHLEPACPLLYSVPAFHSTPKPEPLTTRSSSRKSIPSPSSHFATLVSHERQLEPHPVTKTGLWVNVKTRSGYGYKRPVVQFADDTGISEKPPPLFVPSADSRLHRGKIFPWKENVTAGSVLLSRLSRQQPEVLIVKHPDKPAGLDRTNRSTQTQLGFLVGKSFDEESMDDQVEVERPELQHQLTQTSDFSDDESGDYTSHREALVPSYRNPGPQKCYIDSDSSSELEDTEEPLSSHQRLFPTCSVCQQYRPAVKFAFDPARRIHNKINHLLKTCCHSNTKEDYLSVEELELTSKLRKSIDAREKRNHELSSDKNLTIHLGDRDYWSTRMREFTGKPHRLLFDETLEKAYKRLYERAKRTD